MKIPNPKISSPKFPSTTLPINIPGIRRLAEPRWDKTLETLHTQIADATKAGRSYGDTITPTLQQLEKLLPRVEKVEGPDAVAQQLCTIVISEDMQCGIQEFCLAAPHLECLNDARVLDYHSATRHLTTAAAALIGARFDDGALPPAIDTAMAFDAVFHKFGTAPHEDSRARFYTRLSPQEVMEALSHFEYRPY